MCLHCHLCATTSAGYDYYFIVSTHSVCSALNRVSYASRAGVVQLVNCTCMSCDTQRTIKYQSKNDRSDIAMDRSTTETRTGPVRIQTTIHVGNSTKPLYSHTSMYVTKIKYKVSEKGFYCHTNWWSSVTFWICIREIQITRWLGFLWRLFKWNMR